MKTVALIFLCAATAYGQTQIRNVYLPPWSNKEVQQPCSITVTGLVSAVIQVQHPCMISLEREWVTVTNGVTSIPIAIDLKRAHDPFMLELTGFSPEGQPAEKRTLACHLSLVPATTILEIHGNSFVLKNISSLPFRLESKRNTELKEATEGRLAGTFSAGAALKLEGQPAITLQRTNR